MGRGLKTRGSMRKSAFISAGLCLITTIFLNSITSCSRAQKSGRQESRERNYARIVSLSPAGTEILCGIGAMDQIVARTDFCDFPPEVTQKPSVGGFSAETLSVETILFYKPDFVYGAYGMHDGISRILEQAGIPVYLSNVNSAADVLNEICIIGNLTGHTEESLDLYKKLRQIFSGVENAVSGSERPAVYYEVWSSPFMSAGSKSYIANLIESAGGTNIFSDTAEPYPLVSEEFIILKKPEIIIVPDINGETGESIKSRRGWSSVPAVKNGRIYLAESDVLSRPGPRIAEALVMLAQMIHPEIDFSGIDTSVTWN